MAARSMLTPQMLAYQERFADSGDVRWLPYLMYFHPQNHRSRVVNTDEIGFRFSESRGRQCSVARSDRSQPVRLLAGSSTVFGIGASEDRWTLPSRLGEHDTRPQPWLNFGGRSFNSTQEVLLMVLYRHLLPPVEEIVIFSGFNNLGLARLPAQVRQDHGAFFSCHQFHEAMHQPRSLGIKEAALKMLKGSAETLAPQQQPSLAEQIRYAADLTVRHLHIWKLLAADLGAKLTYVLQPLSGWVRPVGCSQEEALFAELDALGRFTETYGDILTPEVCMAYAQALKQGTEALGIPFINLSPVLTRALDPDQWLFVDRIHFTDEGHDFVAKQLLGLLGSAPT